MAISDSQKVDLLYKKLFGVSKTDLPGNKGLANESIASSTLNRGDKVWTQAGNIPSTPASVPNIVQAYQTTGRIECTADITSVLVNGVYPTWKTNLTDWITPEFGSGYFISVYADTTGASDPTSTGTALSDSGISGVGEWFFDYQAGVLNFIGGSIPAYLVSNPTKKLFIVGYRYIGLIGTSNLSNATVTGNVSAGNVIVTGAIVANSLVVSGLNLSSLVTSNIATNSANAQTIVSNSIAANIWTGIYTANVVESASNLYYTNARVYANVAPLIATKANVSDLTTSNVVELNNLYYSNARVLSNVAQMSINVFADVDITGIGTNGTLIWNGNSFVAGVSSTATESNFANTAGTANIALVTNFANTAGTANIANTVSTLSNFTTANLAEGTNLYYTNARVNAQVAPNLALKANVVDLTTANVSELNNLYYTNSRVYSNVTSLLPTFTGNIGAGNVTIGSGTGGSLIGANLINAVNISATNWLNLYTSNVSEVNNLYYTNARVLSNVTQMSINVFADVDITGIANTGILIWNGTSFVAGTTPPATSANFANIAGTANVALVANVANTVLSISNFTTSNLAEDTNLYYTNVRVNAQVESNLRLKANIVDLTTSNVVELNNLYYSNARVLSNVTQMSINVFADVDITNIQPNDTLVWDGTKFIKANAGQSTAIVSNVTTTGNVEITRFSTSTYSTAKYVYTVKGTSVGYTNKYNSGELLVMHDDTSSFITQYAMISNDINLDLLSFQAGINNGNVIIYGNVSDPAIQVTVKLTGATYTAK